MNQTIITLNSMTQYSDAQQQGDLPVQHSFLVDTMSQHSHTSREKDVIRQKLVQALKSEHALWSYDNDSVTASNFNDDLLIEKVLTHLDLDDIKLLFKLFSRNTIKRVWLEYMVPQGAYLYTLNKFIAIFYFDIKKPDQYLKAMETRHFNKLII